LVGVVDERAHAPRHLPVGARTARGQEIPRTRRGLKSLNREARVDLRLGMRRRGNAEEGKRDEASPELRVSPKGPASSKERTQGDFLPEAPPLRRALADQGATDLAQTRNFPQVRNVGHPAALAAEVTRSCGPVHCRRAWRPTGYARS